jgi:hypothetical protein
MSGGNFDATWVDREHAEDKQDHAVAREKRYASTLTSSQPCQLGGADCQLATIEIANVDQVKIAPTRRSGKIQVLIARAPLEFSVRHHGFPTYLLAGYSNQPDRFDAELPDFQDFLRRIVLREHRGLTLLPAPGVESQPPAATGPGEASNGVAAPPPPSSASGSEPTHRD